MLGNTTLCYSLLLFPSRGQRYYIYMCVYVYIIIIQIIHSRCQYTHYNTLYRQNWLHKPFLPHWQYLDTWGCRAQSQHLDTQFVIAIWQRRAAGVKTGNLFNLFLPVKLKFYMEDTLYCFKCLVNLFVVFVLLELR